MSLDRLFFGRGGVPLSEPEDVVGYLGQGRKHWVKGRSAYELAHSWFSAAGVPDAVRGVLATDPALGGAELIRATFEVQTELDDLGRGPSQTDLVALLQTRRGVAVLGIEGKVDEPFGQLVCEWLDYSPARLRRLASLVERLDFRAKSVGRLRYQLLHRTAAVLIEAERNSACDAVLLVQSFSPSPIRAGFDDFRRFAETLGAGVDAPGRLSPPRRMRGVELRLGWCETPLSA